MACNKESIIRLTSVDSTNRYLRDEASRLRDKCAQDGFVVVTAEYQSAGRGQRGNIWSSDKSVNLLFSILVRPGNSLKVTDQFLLSQATALALHYAMKSYGIDTRLKWPNDIYVGNRKLAGMLLELDYCGTYVEQAIIGVGLNVNQEVFLEMDRNPVSMKMLHGHDFDLENVLATVLDSFRHFYDELCNGNGKIIAAEYTDQLLGLNEQRTFIDNNGRFKAIIEGVDSIGHLLLRHNDGVVLRYAFKEVEQVL